MFHHKLAQCLLALCFVAAAPSITADEWLSGDTLEKRCEAFLADSKSEEGALCVAFMQGFIAGVRTAEELSGRLSDRKADESYAERATRTRASGPARRYRQLQRTEYCIGEDVSAVTVIEKITSYLKAHPDSPELTASELVHQALVESFPCASE